jgi:serine/threonine protein kinase
MAAVYLARRDTDASELVALKLVHPNLLAHAGFVQMFLDEARIASQLRHPNICRVKDFGAALGTYYLAMEYLVGEPLSSVFRRASTRGEGRRHAALIARLIVDACDGLHAAHELVDDEGNPLNVVHRDVSPENLFVTYDAVLKVVDFGIACAAHQTHRTRTGILKGKFGYIAPELLRGEKVDRRADVWGLGIVAWELLTGRRLFRRRSDVETLDAVANGSIVAPSAVRTSLPSAFDAVILRALARDRSKRFATAADLGNAIREVLGASLASQAEVASWLGEHFHAERRRKVQLLELLNRMPCSAPPEWSLQEAPTRFRTSVDDTRPSFAGRHSQGSLPRLFGPSYRRASSKSTWSRRQRLAGALLVGSAAVASALAWGRTGTFAKKSAAAPPQESMLVQSSESSSARAPAGSETPLQRQASLEPGLSLAKQTSASSNTTDTALELPANQGYVLELGREPKRAGKLVLRIRPDTTADEEVDAGVNASEAAPKSVGSRETASNTSVTSNDAGAGTPDAPPTWLRDALFSDLPPLLDGRH